MIYALFGWAHAAVLRRTRGIRRLLAPEPGQGTVEYVGLILLVSLLMVGMVAAMKGFQGEQGLEIAEVIVAKIKSAVNAITFK
jgi:Flp pilus assembly pilin Flp